MTNSGVSRSRIDREANLVELVDEDGVAVGSCSVAEAHRRPGLRHRAFSVLLFDDAGQVLLQQRAVVKTRFPSRWSNTCCGHPAPGQSVVDAAAVRLDQELGLAATVTDVGIYRYQASDPRSDQAECEWDHVLVGILSSGTPAPDPAEVSEWTWADPDELAASISIDPDCYTPWLAGVLAVAMDASAIPR